MPPVEPTVLSKPFATQPIREAFGRTLTTLAHQDPRVVALCADLTESLRLETFARELPERFFEVGVAEQNLLGIAAGLALAGKIPFACSFAAFNPGRNWDQLRVSVCYAEANVKVVGSHAGLSVGEDGATHQALEDLAITRVVPNLLVAVPTDALEMEKMLPALIAHQGPVYLRFGRAASPIITTPETPFALGKAHVFRQGKDVTLCACGPVSALALQAAEVLAHEGVEASILVFPTLKPFDQATVEAFARATGALVSIEDAQIIGGLGGALCETVAELYPVPVVRVGVADRFGQSGKADELYAAYNITVAAVVQAARTAITRKRGIL